MAAVHTPIRFVSTPDGVRIAHASHGSGPPLVYVRGWVSHLELTWNRPGFSTYWDAIGEHFTVTRYDTRGNGLSDREVSALSLETLVLDLEAVMNALNIERAVLYGSSFGGPIAVAYAAKHPERVSKLILDGTYARGADIASPERLQTYLTMFRNTPDIAGVAMGLATRPETDRVPMPGRDMTWAAITAEAAEKLYELGFTLDVTDLLPRLTMPTLVMHRRRSRAFPFELGRRLAGMLPDARFVALEGVNHETWDGDMGPGLAAVGEFLDVPMSIPDATSSMPDTPLVLLFTDIVGSTSLTQRLGDELAQRVLHAHNEAVRRALVANGGREVKHTGDGIMASFPSATRALSAARAMRETVRDQVSHDDQLRFAVRIGINAGEPVRDQGDLFGTAVQLARRLCDAAGENEILVSSVVRELAAGKAFAFEDRGLESMKGFDEPVRVYSVR